MPIFRSVAKQQAYSIRKVQTFNLSDTFLTKASRSKSQVHLQSSKNTNITLVTEPILLHYLIKHQEPKLGIWVPGTFLASDTTFLFIKSFKTLQAAFGLTDMHFLNRLSLGAIQRNTMRRLLYMLQEYLSHYSLGRRFRVSTIDKNAFDQPFRIAWKILLLCQTRCNACFKSKTATCFRCKRLFLKITISD